MEAPPQAPPLSAVHRVPKKDSNSGDSDCLTFPPVHNLRHCRFAIRAGGRSWGRPGGGLKARVEEAIGEVGVFLQIPAGREIARPR